MLNFFSILYILELGWEFFGKLNYVHVVVWIKYDATKHVRIHRASCERYRNNIQYAIVPHEPKV